MTKEEVRKIIEEFEQASIFPEGALQEYFAELTDRDIAKLDEAELRHAIMEGLIHKDSPSSSGPGMSHYDASWYGPDV